MGVEADGQAAVLVAFVRAPLDLPHVIGAREAGEARALVEQLVELIGRQSARELEHDAGIEVARARSHHQAFERRHAHAGLDAASLFDGGDAGAAAEVAGNHAKFLRSLLSDARRPPWRHRRG